MTKVAGWLFDVERLERQVQRLKDMIAQEDEPAREMYNATQRDLPNWQCRGWGELTENERFQWRAKINS